MILSRKAQTITESATLAISSKAKKMKSEGIDVVDFGVGEPDFDTPEHIKAAAIDAIKEGYTKYTPATGIPQLKQAIANKLQRDNALSYKPSDIVVSNGAKHALFNAFYAILNPGDEVIMPAPCWVSYPELVKLADGVPVMVSADESNAFKTSADVLRKYINGRTKAILINSPNNPTGTVYAEEELKAIADLACEYDLVVVSDEIYEKLIYDDAKHVSIASFNDDIKARTIVINGVSKTYAMTGWRIGYSASNEEIASIIGNVQSQATSNPNSIAQYAALAALQGTQQPVTIMVEEFKKRRDYICQRINGIEGLSCMKPTGAFYVMMNISQYTGQKINGCDIMGSIDFAQMLLDKVHVAVVPGEPFGDDRFVRLSYATSIEQIEKGLARIEQCLK
ncbi:pyridoxal phosphate-dependent aminotransferase [Mahella australiensis]|uniref:Aminotransferase n=1 Tax=Mahella australiensis (strain DSM 15567 / CIP 107919 / 50-1 BON) TaxID=697281 RepID=F4A0I6_MAHA5|nr:pyridoxal phosphate-dependent aminotransferase [Mahella australiensis]AEE95865.1 aminotransferase class I and II [Mahella australiensis 50-1 BON]